MDPQEALQLRDIHLPGSPDFWPPALGWWLLLTVILCFLFWLVVKVKRRIRKKKQHQILFDKFEGLALKLREHPDNEVLAEINILLRQLAIAHYPRAEIASLTGGDWLHFLDESGKTQGFSRGAGRILMDAPYRSDNLRNLNTEEFIPLIRNWISKNLKKPPKSRGVCFE